MISEREKFFPLKDMLSVCRSVGDLRAEPDSVVINDRIVSLVRKVDRKISARDEKLALYPLSHSLKGLCLLYHADITGNSVKVSEYVRSVRENISSRVYDFPVLRIGIDCILLISNRHVDKNTTIPEDSIIYGSEYESSPIAQAMRHMEGL